MSTDPNISGEWLANGIGYMNPEDDPAFKLMSNHNRVPFLSFDEVKKYINHGMMDKSIQSDLYLLTTAVTGAHGFATRLEDSSMYPRFNKDTYLIINRDKEVTDKEFVIVYIHEIDDIIFRQVELSNEGIILKPINNELFKYIKLKNHDKIIGALVEARWQF
ncbi:MAG: S24 family peptidase [Legionellales bacterium]|nr:S24 family peptidase [Legionellales bacterium]